MKTETWLESMVNDIQSKKPQQKEEVNVKLSESDMNHLADLMIKKMGDEPPKKDDPEPEKETVNTKPSDPDETPIE